MTCHQSLRHRAALYSLSGEVYGGAGRSPQERGRQKAGAEKAKSLRRSRTHPLGGSWGQHLKNGIEVEC